MISYTQQLYSGTATATGNTQATPVITRHAKECALFLDITAVSGTLPTLDVTINIYDRFSGKWYLLATFTQKSSVTTDVGYVEYGLGEKMSITYTIGGTTPSFTFAINATLKER